MADPKPPFLALIAGRNGYAVKQASAGWYHLTRAGERFPLAGGSMNHIMRTYAGL
jgi:hypothetical protein